MKKKFDAVKMMRNIRDELVKKYIISPDIEDKELEEIRKKYGIESKERDLVIHSIAGLCTTLVIPICKFLHSVSSRIGSKQFLSHHLHHKELYNPQFLYGSWLWIHSSGIT